MQAEQLHSRVLAALSMRVSADPFAKARTSHDGCLPSDAKEALVFSDSGPPGSRNGFNIGFENRIRHVVLG